MHVWFAGLDAAALASDIFDTSFDRLDVSTFLAHQRTQSGKSLAGAMTDLGSASDDLYSDTMEEAAALSGHAVHAEAGKGVLGHHAACATPHSGTMSAVAPTRKVKVKAAASVDTPAYGYAAAADTPAYSHAAHAENTPWSMYPSSTGSQQNAEASVDFPKHMNSRSTHSITQQAASPCKPNDMPCESVQAEGYGSPAKPGNVPDGNANVLLDDISRTQALLQYYAAQNACLQSALFAHYCSRQSFGNMYADIANLATSLLPCVTGVPPVTREPAPVSRSAAAASAGQDEKTNLQQQQATGARKPRDVQGQAPLYDMLRSDVPWGKTPACGMDVGAAQGPAGRGSLSGWSQPEPGHEAAQAQRGAQQGASSVAMHSREPGRDAQQQLFSSCGSAMNLEERCRLHSDSGHLLQLSSGQVGSATVVDSYMWSGYDSL